MAQPQSAGNDAPTREEEQPEPLSFPLVIVSPSVGAASRLSFPHLSANTTVKQLKAKVRDALPSKPVDDSQRLIHRGRMLGRDSETMLEIFGQETLCNPEPQTLHLVLRPAEGASAPSLTSTPVARPPPPAIPPPSNNNPLIPLPQPQPRSQSTPVPAHPFQGMQAQQPLPGFQHVQQHQVLHQAEHYYHHMAQRLQQLQRETQRLQQEMGSLEQRYRTQGGAPGALNPGQHGPGIGPGPGHAMVNPLAAPQVLLQLPHLGLRPPQAMPPSVQTLIAQQQRERAAEGRHGAQDNSGNVTPVDQTRLSSSGRASPNVHRPNHTTTYTRDGTGPNGERWQVTVNETTTTLPMPQPHIHHHHPSQQAPVNAALDIQAVLRNADRYLAAQNNRTAPGNMQRSASNPQQPLSQEAVGSPTPAISQSNTGSIATPATTDGSPSASAIPNPLTVNNEAAAAAAAGTPSPESTVYILSSPQGPRALLVSNSATFFTPRQHSRRHRHDPAASAQARGQAGAAMGIPEYQNGPEERQARRNRRQRNDDQFQQVNVPHANPGAGALAAQIGPILWLMIRLVGFVWFFTSGNSSWARWIMVSGLAFVVFLINTGIFNGLAEQVWSPIRRHLEALLPLAGPEAALVPAANAAIPQPGAAPARDNQEAPARGQGEPDPAEIAARLLAERRRANGGWLMAQIRRAEHALLLFLASLVPGVGERHIAAREAEANAAAAERQRLEAEAEAAAAAERSEEGEGEGGHEQETSTEAQTGVSSGDQPGQQDQPLIEI
ncbi:uncharacterized protein BP5553_00396 [Venustampulla echinocandica]|uniref:Ubiquitin-like domain-containing protein n=1 Tax=Venustampulla echinocandica TaxID=2656787 RepID=A0A370TY16_9HELO|nr:uncharacterized protein BP5553_00396 [Venustampulla echinocandica]RDL40417.1 hypothetical protein BP5553_00396 [Venustampulla echinocandica]